MVIYLLVLSLIAGGAISLAYSLVQNSLQQKRIGLYDARGFYLVLLVFIIFVLTSLAYFWGEARFEPSPEQLSESLIGVLFALLSCLAGLAYGLIRLKEANS